MNFNTNLYKRQYYAYLNLRKKYLINNANIFFNKKCQELRLTPKYARAKSKPYSKAARISNNNYQENRISNELKFLYKKKNYLSLKLYEHELRNMNLYGPIWHSLKHQMLNKLSIFINTKYHKLNLKIQQLVQNQIKNISTYKNNKNCKKTCKPDNRNQFDFQEPINNLSDTMFDENEKVLIYNNFKSNYNKQKNSEILDNIIVQTENIIRQNSNINQDSLRYKISDITTNYFQQLMSVNKDNNNNIKTVIIILLIIIRVILIISKNLKI